LHTSFFENWETEFSRPDISGKNRNIRGGLSAPSGGRIIRPRGFRKPKRGGQGEGAIRALSSTPTSPHQTAAACYHKVSPECPRPPVSPVSWRISFPVPLGIISTKPFSPWTRVTPYLTNPRCSSPMWFLVELFFNLAWW
jgi:hypothetical protein